MAGSLFQPVTLIAVAMLLPFGLPTAVADDPPIGTVEPLTCPVTAFWGFGQEPDIQMMVDEVMVCVGDVPGDVNETASCLQTAAMEAGSQRNLWELTVSALACLGPTQEDAADLVDCLTPSLTASQHAGGPPVGGIETCTGHTAVCSSESSHADEEWLTPTVDHDLSRIAYAWVTVGFPSVGGETTSNYRASVMIDVGNDAHCQ